ncbi:unnamed protein product [Symbiodinium sp. CCMP2592]|nr:unnamed protein product [Symbiodinium sp. CCMP2592]
MNAAVIVKVVVPLELRQLTACQDEDERAVVPAAKGAAKAAAAPSTRFGRKKAVSEYVCGFCGCRYGEAGLSRVWRLFLGLSLEMFCGVDEWGSTPTACFACEDRALVLRPGETVVVLLHLFTHPNEDGGVFKGEFDEATEGDSSFQPKSTVATKEVYGYQIFQDYAVLTDNELGPLLGSLPTKPGSLPGKKKKKDVVVPWLGPDSSCHYNLVDLSELSYESTIGLRKARLFFESSSERSKIFLRPETQLVESQGDHVFKHVAESCIAARPAGLTPSAARPKTVKELKNDIAQMELDLVGSGKTEEQDKDDDEPMEPEADPGSLRTGKKRQAGIGFVAPVPKKASKNKGGGKGAKSANPSTDPVVAAFSPSAPSQPAPAGLSAAAACKLETQSQSTAGNGKAKNSLAKFEGDEDMKAVAAYQLSSNSHAPLKSLEGLVAVDFVLGEKEQKTMNNILNGVPCLTQDLVVVVVPLCDCY